MFDATTWAAIVTGEVTASFLTSPSPAQPGVSLPSPRVGGRVVDPGERRTLPAAWPPRVEALDRIEPGAALAAALAAVEGEKLSGAERLAVLRARQRMVSHAQAGLYADIAAVEKAVGDAVGGDPELTSDAASAEVRAALRLTRRAADTEVELAGELCGRLPQVWEALRSGRIDLRRARVIVDGTRHLSESAARTVVEAVIDGAGGSTTGQLRALVARMCVEAAPEEADRRYADAVSERRVVAEATERGTGNLLGLDLPADRVAAVSRRINRIARSLRTADEARTIDQLRADVLLDLLDGRRCPADSARRDSEGGQAGETGGPAGSDRGMVDIVVDLETLVGLADHPGELAGFGPVIAEIARRVVERQHDGEWRWTVTDPDTGLPTASGTTRRRPTAGQRRRVETRDPTCVFPGCRMPASACDLDHRIPWSEGGATTVDQLVPLCRHDHRIRHQAGWTHRPLPGGDHLWTSPLGGTHTTSGNPP